MKSLKPFVHVSTGIIFGVALTFGVYLWSNSDSHGDTNSSCDKFDEPSIASGKGMTVSAHTTACTTIGSSVVSYVYIHPSNQRPTADNLVFRYSQNGGSDSLKVEWIDEGRVALQVEGVSHISKILTTYGSIAIAYRL